MLLEIPLRIIEQRKWVFILMIQIVIIILIQLAILLFILYIQEKRKKAEKDNNIGKMIQRAVTISNSLNRSFVIPPMTCKSNEQSFCNLCFYHNVWCFDKIVSSFTLPFKESV